MMEYISKQLAVEELENLRQFYEMNDDCDELVARKCKNAVAALPVADVAPVVHCRECKHWKPGNFMAGKTGMDKLVRGGRCPIRRFSVYENGFCDEGEKSTDNSTEK